MTNEMKYQHIVKRINQRMDDMERSYNPLVAIVLFLVILLTAIKF